LPNIVRFDSHVKRMVFTMILHVFALIFGFSFTISVKTQSNAYTFIILFRKLHGTLIVYHIFLRVDILKPELFFKELLTYQFLRFNTCFVYVETLI